MGFAEDTRVQQLDATRWSAAVAPGWDIAGNTNGGYLLALAVRAMLEATGRPDPVTVTAHFLRPGKSGDAEVEAQVVKSGRRFATATASLAQGGNAILQVLGSYGDLAGSLDGPERIDSAPPDLPPPDACPRNTSDQNAKSFMQQVDLRLHPDDIGFRSGNPSGEPRVRGWFQLSDAQPLDTVALLLAADSFPPTIFNANLPVGWVPTLELTVHVRARPSPGWLRCAFTTRFVTGGFLEEDGELWDERGRLVAQSRQLALIPHS